MNSIFFQGGMVFDTCQKSYTFFLKGQYPPAFLSPSFASVFLVDGAKILTKLQISESQLPSLSSQDSLESDSD